ncbi:MAG: DUF805 domain-containing protein [Actinobacteria bacterium]|nr:DUF805 domain-containing protein [Actinomycetota bacterium]
MPAGGSALPPVGNPLVGYWKQVVLERYAQFQGRANRPEYWWYALANFILFIALYVVALVFGQVADALGVIAVIVIIGAWLGLLIPTLAVAVRRLHDSDKSGWFLLFYFVPCVGGIIVLIFLVTAGTPGPNRYGAAAS